MCGWVGCRQEDERSDRDRMAEFVRSYIRSVVMELSYLLIPSIKDYIF